jgi:hypothetical protein
MMRAGGIEARRTLANLALKCSGLANRTASITYGTKRNSYEQAEFAYTKVKRAVN